MCAVLGVSGDWNEDTVINLLNWSRIRGLHAFGFSCVVQGIVITKRFLDFNQFKVELLEKRPKKFIAHFRYSTSGDWMSLENNQPITNGLNALVFNGVIDMGTKSEMEINWGCQLASENDGELALIKWELGELKELLKNKTRSFAGIFLTNENKMIAIRNPRRPLWVAECEGCYYLASTSDILSRSGLRLKKELDSYEQYDY
jgi:glutamine phosphoribosylpyrophosphate amidotransferase